MKRVIQLTLSIAFIATTNVAHALNCEPLDPRQQVGKKVDKSIEGSAKTLVKLIGGDISYKNTTENEVKNLYQSYPNADKLVIKGKLIYTFCTFLNDAEDLDSNEKFTKLSSFMATILDFPAEEEEENKTAKKNKAHKTVESDEFVFELKQCKGTSSAIKCSFLVTNVGSDRPLILYAKNRTYVSRIFLDSGDEILSYKSRLGSSESQNYSKATLLTGIPIKASVSFKLSGQDSNKIAAIDLRANKSSIQFRNVSLE
ncbi:hypothetical protein MNBD_GAMMA20-842 [hydrothermal vent metagenome]|uniref:Uncharacterized protein n=1 Tax=hydrothermal vent metagenome TaxID=652676 RepID=A0A3B1A6M4_9ZZZZ